LTEQLPTPSSAAEPDWPASPQGRNLLAAEVLEIRRALDGVFGDHLVQVGGWGGGVFLKAARTRRTAVVADRPTEGAGVLSHLDELAIPTDSVDAVLLAHVLEFHADPHTVLREAERILRPDGYLIVAGFNPHGLWGMRHLLSRRRFPPGVRHLISERRLRDWLRLLNLSVQDSHFYHFQLPFAPAVRPPRPTSAPRPAARRLRGLSGSIWRQMRSWPPFGACYITTSRKEMYTVTPVRPVWRGRRRLVGGLVNPTTRNAA
jgi:SAM-dependent methyltransferase